MSLQSGLQSAPVIFALLTRKTKRAYLAFLAFIERNVCELNPTSVMTDFETALRNALRETYPGINVQGCYFHYTQAIRRQASQIPNMFLALNREPERSQVFHKFLVLPLLPKELIAEGFEILKREAAQFGTTFVEFVEYFNRQWMLKVRNIIFIIF